MSNCLVWRMVYSATHIQKTRAIFDVISPACFIHHSFVEEQLALLSMPHQNMHSSIYMYIVYTCICIHVHVYGLLCVGDALMM